MTAELVRPPSLLFCFNSLAPGRFEWNFRYVIFNVISVVDSWGVDCEIALRWMSLDLTDDKSTLVQVMAWCRQESSHYLNQCWLRYLTPYVVTRPQWVNLLRVPVGSMWYVHPYSPGLLHWCIEVCGMSKKALKNKSHHVDEFVHPV